jgi:hypothetical protein
MLLFVGSCTFGQTNIVSGGDMTTFLFDVTTCGLEEQAAKKRHRMKIKVLFILLHP